MNPRPSWQRVSIDGVPVDALTRSEVVEHVLASIDRGVGGLVLPANSDLMRRLRTAAHRHLVEGASLIIADGMPLVWASRLMHRPLPERVNGTNLLVDLCSAAAAGGRSVFLLGAAPGVAAEAAEELQRQAPGLAIAGVASPPVAFENDAAEWKRVVELVTAARPDLVFVALGYPRQEEVALRLAEHLPSTWFMGCGGALDFLSGHIERAPVFFQEIGAEWLHRLTQEPRRLARRYLVDDAPYVLGMLYRARRTRSVSQ